MTDAILVGSISLLCAAALYIEPKVQRWWKRHPPKEDHD